MFVSQKLNIEMFGDTSKKKNMVIFIMKKGVFSPENLTARL